MSVAVDPMLARLERLPARLRIAHLAALLRLEADGSPRAAELKRLLAAQLAFGNGRTE
jgi:hypothetical protein